MTRLEHFLISDKTINFSKSKFPKDSFVAQRKPIFSSDCLKERLNLIRTQSVSSWGEDASSYVRKLRDDERKF